MMKFVIQKCLSFRSRLGLMVFESLPYDGDGQSPPSSEYTTPMCLQYTQCGTVPHISWDIMHKLRDDNSPALITLPYSIEMKDSVFAFNGHCGVTDDNDFGKFVGMNETRPYVLIIQDPTKRTKSGHNNITGIGVFGSKGKHTIDTKKYMEIVKNFKPHLYQSLCDGDTPYGCGRKRIKNSVERSIEYLDDCIEKSPQSNGRCSLFGTIEGGFVPESRVFSSKETALRPVNGFIIDGFYQNGSENTFDIELIEPILIDTVNSLPKDKPRALFGMFRPNVILHLIKNGIDIFDSSYATAITERGCAFLPFLDVKQLKITHNLIDLNDCETFKEDFNVISDGCECYTCSNNFTKAYINHLLNASEMTAQVLLMFHNLHIYYKFFEDIRKVMREDQFDQLIKQNNY